MQTLERLSFTQSICLRPDIGSVNMFSLVMISSTYFCFHSTKGAFLKKIQDWILKSEGIRKWFCVSLLNRSIQDLSDHGASMEQKNPLWEVDSLTLHDLKDLGLICLVKKRKIRFRIPSDLRIQSWIFLKKRTLVNSLSEEPSCDRGEIDWVVRWQYLTIIHRSGDE